MLCFVFNRHCQVLETFLIAGIPLHKVNDEVSGLKELLEHDRGKLSKSDLDEKIPLLLEFELNEVAKEVKDLEVCVWFDGTTNVHEVNVIGVRYDNTFQLPT